MVARVGPAQFGTFQIDTPSAHQFLEQANLFLSFDERCDARIVRKGTTRAWPFSTMGDVLAERAAPGLTLLAGRGTESEGRVKFAECENEYVHVHARCEQPHRLWC